MGLRWDGAERRTEGERRRDGLAPCLSCGSRDRWLHHFGCRHYYGGASLMPRLTESDPVLVRRDSGGVFPDGTTNHPAPEWTEVSESEARAMDGNR